MPWVTRDGRYLEPQDMSSDHILNTLNMCWRWGERVRLHELISSAFSFARTDNVEDILEAEEQRVRVASWRDCIKIVAEREKWSKNETPEMGAIRRLQARAVPDLEAEAARRGLDWPPSSAAEEEKRLATYNRAGAVALVGLSRLSQELNKRRYRRSEADLGFFTH